MRALALVFVDGLVHLSPSTLRGLRLGLCRSVRHWEGRGCLEPGHITEGVLESWCLFRLGEASRGTVHADVRLADRFLCWLVREGFLLSNPMPSWLLERHKFTGRNMRLVPSRQAVEVLLSRAATSSMAQRNVAVVEVLYGCGLRNGELCGLDLGDWRGDCLRVRGKFGTERMVPVGRVATAALVAYVNGDRSAMLRKHNPRERALFLSYEGKRLGVMAVCALFRCTLGRLATAHRLRHACATHMLRNGAGIAVLRDLLGHRGISATRIYTEVKVEDVRECLKKFHPRG